MISIDKNFTIVSNHNLMAVIECDSCGAIMVAQKEALERAKLKCDNGHELED